MLTCIENPTTHCSSVWHKTHLVRVFVALYSHNNKVHNAKALSSDMNPYYLVERNLLGWKFSME